MVVHFDAFDHPLFKCYFQLGKLNDHLSDRELFICFTASVFYKHFMYVCISFPLGLEDVGSDCINPWSLFIFLTSLYLKYNIFSYLIRNYLVLTLNIYIVKTRTWNNGHLACKGSSLKRGYGGIMNAWKSYSDAFLGVRRVYRKIRAVYCQVNTGKLRFWVNT